MMKMVISKGKKKRQIDGSFELCASLEDFRTLRNEISRVIDREEPFAYGWIQVIPNRPKAIANTPAEPWDDTLGGDTNSPQRDAALDVPVEKK